MLGHRKRSLTRARIQPHAKDKRDAFGRKYTMTIQGIQAFQGLFRASSRLFASQYERMAAFSLVQPHVVAKKCVYSKRLLFTIASCRVSYSGLGLS
jgi:hypothetical protein